MSASPSRPIFHRFEQQGSARAQFTINSKNGQSLQGSSMLGSISFVPGPGQSAFVPLTITNAAGTNSDGSIVSSVVGEGGRIVVIGAEPLLEARTGNSAQHQLVLYGNPGASYQLASSTNLSATNWTLLSRIPMTNLDRALVLDGSPLREFYRAWEFSANPPLLELGLLGGTNASLMLYGQSGSKYSIESATSLSPAADWTAVTNLFLTNSFAPAGLGTPTNRAIFFRAMPK